jgi:hypothetical protein
LNEGGSNVKAAKAAAAGTVVAGVNIAGCDKNQCSGSCELIDSIVDEVTSACGNGTDKEFVVPVAGVGVLNAGTDSEFERIAMRRTPDSETFLMAMSTMAVLRAAFWLHV